MKHSAYLEKRDICNVRLHTKNSPLLPHLDLELTERCNNNCIHCTINLPANDQEAKKRELSTKEIMRTLREAADLGCLKVRFTGGEPLLREDFEEIYLFARKLGLKVIIFTNATLINEHLAELFSKFPPLELIEVTLYGMKKSSYETITRNRGSFKSAWQGVNLLLKKKVPFIVKWALLPSNKAEIEEFEQWAKTIPWMIAPPEYSMFFELRARRDNQKNELIKKLRITPKEGMVILTRQKDKYLKEMKEFCTKFTRPTGENIFSCGAGTATGCVDAYGFFQPCLSLRDPGYSYNLKKDSLKAALTNLVPKIRKSKAKNEDYLNRCGRCFLKGLCKQCPAASWTEHRTPDTPVEYLCEITHVKARYLGLLKEGEKTWTIKDWKKRIHKFSKKEDTKDEKTK